jgi:pimeloyl-ACP methyl ester carboxylesterase
VALAVGRSAVAIDLPGHGRSDWRRDGRYEPASLASALAEAIRSFAPRARLVAGTGLGGLTALALRRRYARLLPALALIGTLPGLGSGRAWQRSGPERYASRADALAGLAPRRPESSGQARPPHAGTSPRTWSARSGPRQRRSASSRWSTTVCPGN